MNEAAAAAAMSAECCKCRGVAAILWRSMDSEDDRGSAETSLVSSSSSSLSTRRFELLALLVAAGGVVGMERAR